MPSTCDTVLTFLVFFFNDTATTEIYTLSLHDALPIFSGIVSERDIVRALAAHGARALEEPVSSFMTAKVVTCTGETSIDRKSTRLNSSHANISYAVFCLKKKKKK